MISMKKWLPFSLLLVLAIGCSKSDDESEPVEIKTLTVPEDVKFFDVANNGNASDMEVAFSLSSNFDVSEFRVFILKESSAEGFDLDGANSIITDNYAVVSKFKRGIRLDSTSTDVDGNAIVEGASYVAIVMAVADTGSDLDEVLSTPTSKLELRQLRAVSTLTGAINAGSGGLDVDAQGNIYMADFGASLNGPPGTRVHKITPEGEVSVFANGLVGASGNDFDPDGNLIQSNISNGTVSKITPEGMVTTIATGFSAPVGVVHDGESAFYVCNCGSNTISKVDDDGTVSLFSSSTLLNCPNGIDMDSEGNLYIANFSNGTVVKITPTGMASSFASIPGANNGHLLINGSSIYVVGRGANSIYKVSFGGTVSLFAGTGVRGLDNGSLLKATFSLPNDIAFSPDGRKLYINDVGTLDPDTGVLKPVVIREIDLLN